jgi:hypothetical protein
VTGTFDQWSSSICLVKGDAGFSGTVKVPWGEKVTYKFIVDGHWQCREDRPQEKDGHGNVNNVLQTPEKPLPPARLTIPVDNVHGDVDNMVTAVEFLTPAEIASTKGSLPLSIPHITVEGLTPVSDFKVNTATATEGHGGFPASETPTKLEPAPFEQAPASCDVSTLPTNDNGSVLLPLNDGETHDPHSMSTHAPIQFTKGELPISAAVSETAVSAPLESAVPEPDHSLQGAQDTPAVTDRTGAAPAPAPAPASTPESTAKQPQPRYVEAVASGQVTPPPVGQASSFSTPSSSTLTHKKRRSFFAKIKHIFERDHDKQGKKEKSKR